MSADIMVVGEAPSERDIEQGGVFSGQGGRLVREVLTEVGLDPEKMFFTNAVSCSPLPGKAPTKGEINKCKRWLDHQIQLVKPKYVLLLGNTPLQSVTGKAGITKRRGKPIEQDGVIYLPAYNPVSVLKDDELEDRFVSDLSFFSEIIEFGGVPEEEGLDNKLVISRQDVEDMLADLKGTVSFDIETNSLNPWQKKNEKGEKDPAKIVAIGFASATNQWTIPFNHPQSPWTLEELVEIVERLDEVLEDCLIVTHNGKFDMLWMRVHYGVVWEIAFDTMLAHYILDENDRHGLKYLAQKYFGAPDWEIDKEEKQGHAPLGKIAKYHAHDVYYTRALRYHLGKMLAADPEVKDVFDLILMPCANLFSEIEYHGVYIDEGQFEEAERVIRGMYNEALAKLKEWEPEYVIDGKGKRQPFNWGSPKQLAKLLYEDLGIDPPMRTKTGAPSCSESALNQIDHPCIGDLIKFRGAKQQLSFFIDGWKPFLDYQEDGAYLHPSFKLHGTVTGRLSCETPNLQQVPRDKRIRTLISAPPGWTLIECDLSQIELRVAAELANEQNMLSAFANRIDVHWLTIIREMSRAGAEPKLVIDTAKTWKQHRGKITYGEAIDILLEMGPDAAIDIDGEWKEFRKKAKAINFGYLYGMWWKKFKMYARDNYGVEVTDEQAKGSRIAFFSNYPGFNGWHKRQKQYANKHGFVKSLSGRKRRLPDAKYSKVESFRKAAERQAVNSPVQSFANDINLMAALQLREEYGPDVVRMCGTVHDAILLRVRDDYVEEVYSRLLTIMQRPALMDVLGIDIFVPIEADGSIGPWGAGVPLDRWKRENLRVSRAKKNRRKLTRPISPPKRLFTIKRRA